MNPYRLRLTPLSAFGTRPMGDTLFGQLCWAVRNRHGEEKLTGLLDGYTENRPFAVLSDAFPAGHLPRPALPTHGFDLPEGDRKAVKRRAWLPIEAFGEPVERWLQHCKAPSDVAGANPQAHPQPHNTLNRESGTTGTGAFAPYAMEQLWYGANARLDLYILLDETRLTAAELKILLDDIGRFGFGRDASIGLGKFETGALEPTTPLHQAEANAYLTLAPCAPQGLGLDPQRSFYQPFTRFGRHGDIGVRLQGGPFKAPLLLAQTGAVFSPLAADEGPHHSPLPPAGEEFGVRAFVGQGLGGDGSLSNTIKATVHQGYAPVVGIRLPRCL